MNAFNLTHRKRVNLLITLLLLFLPTCLTGQVPSYSYFYRVYFKDKGENTTEKYSATEILSSRAIERRKKVGIQVPDFRDVPVSGSYLNEISLPACS